MGRKPGRMSEGWGSLGNEEGRAVLTAQGKVGLSFLI